jgi:hypothetical protein
VNYPELDESASDKKLIEEFYRELQIRYPELKEDIEYNDGLLHLDMSVLQQHAENLCKEKKQNELSECFKWVNSLFCRSKNELLNAINVSFLEYFNYQKGLTEKEFKEIMPKELYRGYTEMMEYMEKLEKDYKEKNNET